MTTVFVSKKLATKSLGSLEDFGMSKSEFNVFSPVGFVSDKLASASATFGVFKLSLNYSGPCVQVLNGMTSTDIYFDSDGVVDRVALLAAAAGGTLHVTKWYDQSGHGLHAVVVVGRIGPVIVEAGAVIEVNGLPAVKAQSSTMQLKVPHNLTAPFTVVLASAQSGGSLPNSSAGCVLPALGGAYFDEFTATASNAGLIAAAGTKATPSAVRGTNPCVMSVTRHDGAFFSRAANGGPIQGVAGAYAPGATSLTLGGGREGSTNINMVMLQVFSIVPACIDDVTTGYLSIALNKLLNYY